MIVAETFLYRNKSAASSNIAHKDGGAAKAGQKASQACSFLKKRTKKLLLLRHAHDRGHGRDHAAGGGTKVFCFFSSEKKMLLHSIESATLPVGSARRARSTITESSYRVERALSLCLRRHLAGVPTHLLADDALGQAVVACFAPLGLES
jgi:hypothetical protein